MVALALTISPHAFAQSDELKKEVLASFQSLVSAAKRLDTQRYFQHFDKEKFVGLSSDGTNWNSIEQFAPLINNGFTAVEKVVSLEFPNVKVSIIDDNTAILVNEFVQSTLLKNGQTIEYAGGGTQVWSKHSGQWKLVSVSASNKS